MILDHFKKIFQGLGVCCISNAFWCEINQWFVSFDIFVLLKSFSGDYIILRSRTVPFPIFIQADSKVDCSGKSLRVLRNIWGFWNAVSFNKLIKTRKIPWGNTFTDAEHPKALTLPKASCHHIIVLLSLLWSHSQVYFSPTKYRVPHKVNIIGWSAQRSNHFTLGTFCNIQYIQYIYRSGKKPWQFRTVSCRTLSILDIFVISKQFFS
jgi:hypothetical protein